ncbi:hypothetical protein CYG49_04475 [Candidatus Saccharibacteria bacterium]|nr:MAG: hypothetical protein CYG49_04475 [Candidatus Saccharibacteria bacterium]
MKYIRQEDEMGCGVACVANLLGTSYNEALQLFEFPENAKTKGFACKYIILALKRAGTEAKLRHISARKPRPKFLPGTIVFLVKSERYPSQHYVLKAQEGWIDPWVNLVTNKDITQAEAGIRKRLPGKPYYAIVPEL